LSCRLHLEHGAVHWRLRHVVIEGAHQHVLRQVPVGLGKDKPGRERKKAHASVLCAQCEPGALSHPAALPPNQRTAFRSTRLGRRRRRSWPAPRPPRRHAAETGARRFASRAGPSAPRSARARRQQEQQRHRRRRFQRHRGWKERPRQARRQPRRRRALGPRHVVGAGRRTRRRRRARRGAPRRGGGPPARRARRPRRRP
jgi:hypothetical protein